MILIPTPNKGESQKDFISRCIPIVINEGTTDDQSQAAAICYSIWRRSKQKEESDMKKDRVLLHLCAKIEPYYQLNENMDKKETSANMGLLRSTILNGNGTYNGIYFPEEELEKAYHTWDKQPINYDHSDRVKDTIGDVFNPIYEKGRITAELSIDGYPESENAMRYIESRKRAGAIPEVSVGVWVDRIYEAQENGEDRLTARNLQGDHLALVTRGACSPQDGCGIGLAEFKPISIPEETNNKFVISFIYDKDEITNKVKEELEKGILKEQIKKERLKGGEI